MVETEKLIDNPCIWWHICIFANTQSQTKNAKEPPSQRTTKDQMNGQLTYKHEGRTANKVLPKAGVTSFYDTFVLNQTLVFQISSSAETPRLRQYPNRCMSLYSPEIG